jgi:hypothetical protein
MNIKIILISDFITTGIFAALIIVFACVGLAISIYNIFKMKGVFLFDDYIEVVSSVSTKKQVIQIEEIENICEIEDFGIGRKTFSFKGGDRKNMVCISFKNIGMSFFKIKNQDEFLKLVREKIENSK